MGLTVGRPKQPEIAHAGRKRSKLRTKSPASYVQKRLPIDPSEKVQMWPVEESIRKLPDFDPYDLADGYEFDVDAAEAVILFFHEQLVHVKGEQARKQVRRPMGEGRC